MMRKDIMLIGMVAVSNVEMHSYDGYSLANLKNVSMIRIILAIPVVSRFLSFPFLFSNF